MHHTYVRRNRRRWALSQDELAELLGTSQVRVSRCETGELIPDIETTFGLQVIFGTSPRGMFPSTYRAIEEKVMARAAEFERKLSRRYDSKAKIKRRLLTGMVHRAHGTPQTA